MVKWFKKHNRVYKVAIPVFLALFLAIVIPNISVFFSNANVTSGPMSLEEMGEWYHYNGVIFNNLTSYQADSEGALAVGKSMTVGKANIGYDIGGSYNYFPGSHIGQYKNPNGWPTLLYGGTKIENAATSQWVYFSAYGGSVVMTQEAHQTSPYEVVSGKKVYAEQATLDKWFANTYQQTRTLSDMFADAKTEKKGFTDITDSSYFKNAADYVNQSIMYEGAVDESILIINVSTGANFEFGWSPTYKANMEWFLDDKYELIVFNFPEAQNVTFAAPLSMSGGTGANLAWVDSGMTAQARKEKYAVAEKLIYNFPNAKQITSTSCSILGSVLAPEASFYGNGGSLNGQLIAQNYETQNGHELHALSVTRKRYKLVEDDEDEETGSIEISKYIYIQGDETNILLSGAQFHLVKKEDGQELYYNDGEFRTSQSEAETIEVTNLKAYEIEGLPLGDYILRETKPPDGYLMNTTDPDTPATYFEYEFTLSQDKEIIQIARYNEPFTTDVWFRKIDKDTKEAITSGDGQFTLIREADKFTGEATIVETKSLNADGTLVFENLPTGTYTIMEIEPPDGYMNQNISEAHFTITRDKERNVLVVSPLYGSDNQELKVSGSGARDDPFLIENQKGTPATYLYLFKYDGSDMDWADQGFRVNYGNNAAPVNAGVDDGVSQPEISEPEEPLGTDEESAEAQTGDQPNPDLNTFEDIAESTEETEMTGEETEPEESPDSEPPEPETRQNDAEVYNTAAENNFQAVHVSNSHSQTMSMETGLPDAGFALYLLRQNESGAYYWDKTDHEIVTNESGFYYTTGLDYGIYRVVETAAPAGYMLSNPYEDDAFLDAEGNLIHNGQFAWQFDLSKEGQNEGAVLAIPNNKMLARVMLSKVGTLQEEESTVNEGVPLDNVEFRLYQMLDEEGENLEVLEQKKTENGVVTFDDLSDGHYRIREVSTVEGFTELNPDYFDLHIDFVGEQIHVELTHNTSEEDEELIIIEDPKPGEDIDIKIKVKNHAGAVNLLLYKRDIDVYVKGKETENPQYIYTYLEGAVFRLQRKDSYGNWIDYGGDFVSKDLDKTDDQGNKLAGAYIENLIAGSYRIIETKAPEGYQAISSDEIFDENGDSIGWRIGQFTVTDEMVATGRETELSYVVYNTIGGDKGDITIEKVDKETHEPLSGTEFKLWVIKEGAESWQGTETLEELMQHYNKLSLLKYATATTGPLVTDDSGKLILTDISPGIYALFENRPPDDYIYMLEPGNTSVSDFDKSFLLYVTLFKVESDDNKGVKIAWVNQERLDSEEVIWDQENNNLTLQITNISKMTGTDVEFKKTDDAGTGLQGAEFEVYRLNPANNQWQQHGETVVSDENGTVRLKDLTIYGNTSKITTDQYTYYEYKDIYMLKEVRAPDGYALSDQIIYFMLRMDPMTKEIRMYLMEDPFATDAAKLTEVDGNNKKQMEGSISYCYELDDFVNERLMSFVFRKVDFTQEDLALKNAVFDLYRCSHEHTGECEEGTCSHVHSETPDGDDSCWIWVQKAKSNDDGIVSFKELESGEYLLIETEAPEGYQLPGGHWKISVDAKANKIYGPTAYEHNKTAPPAFTAPQGESTLYQLGNMPKYSLPIMGANGWRWYIIGSILLFAIGGGLYIYSRSKCEKSNYMDEAGRAYSFGTKARMRRKQR